ncbi:MAG TPA: type II secretion system protein [Verrucomicrobiae bacterium]|jgi:prepilin-type N-terminal cleavage/methylation domain-containing protein/prepilin-type processing-associated H-X9-DG protein
MSAFPRIKPKGFSLIELLLVVAVMGILSALVVGNMGWKHHQDTQMELCADNLQKMFLATQIYANDFGAYPLNTNAQTSEDALAALVPRYSADTTIFTCPAARDSQIPSGASLRKYRISYAYYMGVGTNASQTVLFSDRQINTQSKNFGDQVFSLNGHAPGNNHSKGGGNFLFTDGSVQKSGPQAAFSLLFSNGIVLLNPKP